MKRTNDYDNVFKTMKHRHKRLFISVINETFGKNYPLDSEIEVLPSEGYLTEEETQTGEKNIEEQISDFLIKIGNDVFLLECQSYDDDSMALRIAEYARRHEPDEYACIFTWRRPRANIPLGIFAHIYYCKKVLQMEHRRSSYPNAAFFSHLCETWKQDTGTDQYSLHIS